eukprot:1321283-Rhodomonas_salina.4
MQLRSQARKSQGSTSVYQHRDGRESRKWNVLTDDKTNLLPQTPPSQLQPAYGPGAGAASPARPRPPPKRAPPLPPSPPRPRPPNDGRSP